MPGMPIESDYATDLSSSKAEKVDRPLQTGERSEIRSMGRGFPGSLCFEVEAVRRDGEVAVAGETWHDFHFFAAAPPRRADCVPE